jgi:hypothetical protein
LLAQNGKWPRLDRQLWKLHHHWIVGIH